MDATEAEAARLAELHAFGLLDTLPEPAFDRIARLAQTLVGVPIALISLVDASRQWFKAEIGLGCSQTPRDVAFCSHAIERDGVMVVPDATLDRRFAANPLVVGPPCIRFYAGAPLRTARGHKLGTLCVIDTVPRTPSPAQVEGLADLAAMAVSEMELRRAGAIDALTGLPNRAALLREAGLEFHRARRYGHSLSLISLDLDDLKLVKGGAGPGSGEAALRLVTQEMLLGLRASDRLGRMGGAEFAILLPETQLDGAAVVAERLARRLRQVQDSGQLRVSATMGVASLTREDSDMNDLLSRADQLLYRAKAGGGDCFVCQDQAFRAGLLAAG